MILEHGVIQHIEPETDEYGWAIKARVLPATTAAAPTRPLVIPYWLRGPYADLAVGTDVVFCVFDDMTGLIISRADGDGGKVIPWSIEVLGRVTSQSEVVDGITMETHTHTGVHGETSGPH